MNPQIAYINGLFDTLKKLPGDVHFAAHIRFWMDKHNVTFEELGFTQEELEEVERRQLLAYINRLFSELKRRSGEVVYADYIRQWMRSRGVTFEELGFTQEELEEVERRQLLAYINELFATLKRRSGDSQFAGHIHFWMERHNISFDELGFTEEELEKATRLNT